MAGQKLKGSIPSGGLEGMAVLVTGGGTGIGAACASRLAADGAAVTLGGPADPGLAGLGVHHAFVAFDLGAGGAASFASNAVGLALVP